MAAGEFLQVNPAELRLPSSRRGGVDPLKLHRQLARFGNSTDGMPPLLASRGSDGAIMINDGVTRATRIAKYAPDVLVIVEVIDELPKPVSSFPTVGERL